MIEAQVPKSDLSTKLAIERIAALRAGIPGGVWLLLVIIAAFGCATTSYGGGADGARSKLGSVFLPLLITVTIVLISISRIRAWA
jgi:hypothetical protein